MDGGKGNFMEQHHHERSTFSGKLGFVLSAAGASVGLGNIWRFPYLAAKYGGGIFLLIYIILAMTFGYSMIIAETALGRMTKKSPVGAFGKFGKSKWLSFGGWINAIIPILIVPYYSVIGGWGIKYLVEYVKGNTQNLATDGYFSEFISNGVSTEVCFLVFALFTVGIIYAGVRNGVERVSKFMMPVLVFLSIVITVYSVTRPGALEGVKYFLIPNPKNFSWMTVVAAMGQMFYSLSIAMGILVTFGSYMKKDVSIAADRGDGTAFRCHDPDISLFAEAERTQTKWVTNTDQLARAGDNQGISAACFCRGPFDCLFSGRGSQTFSGDVERDYL